MHKVDEVIERLRNRPHDAPMESEYLMDEAADLLAAMKEALESIIRFDQHREWTATKENPETHWETRDGQCAKVARNALNGEKNG